MAADRKFNIILPTELVKGADGEWKIVGLASTGSRDLQGEVIDQHGLDLTPIDMKKGIFNWDHKKGPENTIGVIDSYKKSKEGLFLSGRLFKEHSKAKAVYEIMSSLNKADTGRMGMSVEGVIKERAGENGKTIKKAVIHSCALTMNPVNVDTYASLVKSFADPDADLEFAKDEEVSVVDQAAGEEDTANQPMFSANQVMAILQKALGVGSGEAAAPSTLMGGPALTQEDLDRRKKNIDKGLPDENSKLHAPQALAESNDGKLVVENKPAQQKEKKRDASKPNPDNGITENGIAKHLKPMSFSLYKSHMFTILKNLQTLYPEYTRSEIWEAVKDRLEKKFPEVVDREK
jgi:hypothetical protein